MWGCCIKQQLNLVIFVQSNRGFPPLAGWNIEPGFGFGASGTERPVGDEPSDFLHIAEVFYQHRHFVTLHKRISARNVKSSFAGKIRNILTTCRPEATIFITDRLASFRKFNPTVCICQGGQQGTGQKAWQPWFFHESMGHKALFLNSPP